MKKLFSIIFLLFTLIMGIGGWGYYKIQQLFNQPINHQTDQLFTLERGTTGKKLAAQLEQQQLLEDASLLPYLLKLHPQFNNVKAGTYSLNGANTLGDLLRILNEGKEMQLSLQFIEGDRFQTWRKQLENAPHLQQSLKDKTEAEIFTLLELPAQAGLSQQKLEGWLYPDKYSYTANSTDIALLKRAADKMQKTLAQAWQNRDPDLPLKTPYEMLILASIVEKESGLAAERPKIASVFINRLKLKIKLQTDPTVIYGMGENYNGNIRKKDLETPTPYNTYVIEGLPPTPIAMPSSSSLMAVANPAKTDFLYFVAEGTGGHKFSKNLAEHNKAVQEYLRWYRNQKNGK